MTAISKAQVPADQKEMEPNSKSIFATALDSFGRGKPKTKTGVKKWRTLLYMQLRAAIIAELADSSKKLIGGFGGDIITTKSFNYDDMKEQYATSSYPTEIMSPFALCYPETEHDIQSALDWAAHEGKKVLMRSGGHQYSGHSSGDKDHVVIDMLFFSKHTFDANNSNIITAGVTIELEPFVRDILLPAQLSLPLGICNAVNLGGHMQTGGYGNIMRSFGLGLDRVIGFRIMFADGSVKDIIKPNGTNEEVINGVTNDEIFWAVLGGNPGSFGCILSWTLNCIKDGDHPNSAAVQWLFVYTRDIMTKVMEEFSKLADEAYQGKIPSDYDFMLTIKQIDVFQGSAGILFEGVFGNVDGKSVYDPQYFQRIYDAAGIPPLGIPKMNGEPRGLSEIYKYCVKTLEDDREFKYAYKKSLRGARVPHQPGFVASFVEQVNAIVFNTKLRVISQVQIGGGALVTNEPSETNLPGSRNTSISHRDIYLGVSFDVFYKFGYEEAAQQIQDECQKLWVADGLFSTDDIRFTWGTFGNTKLEDVGVWKFYYDNDEQYQKLREIKTKVDPLNIFNNEFTLPPLDS